MSIKRIFRLMTPLRALGVLASGCLWAACSTPVQNGLSEGQANQVLVALHGQGIQASKEQEASSSEQATFRVTVPVGEASRALSVLRAAGLPRDSKPGLGEVFGQPSLVPTATEERARYTAALAGDLSRSIESIEGVLDARVHVAIPDPREVRLDENPPSPRASVLVKFRPGGVPYDAKAIRALVAGSVEGMRPEDVAVVGVPGPRLPQAAQASFVYVGPIAVARASAPLFRAVLGAALVLDVVLALGLVWVLIRGRRLTGP